MMRKSARGEAGWRQSRFALSPSLPYVLSQRRNLLDWVLYFGPQYVCMREL